MMTPVDSVFGDVPVVFAGSNCIVAELQCPSVYCTRTSAAYFLLRHQHVEKRQGSVNVKCLVNFRFGSIFAVLIKLDVSDIFHRAEKFVEVPAKKFCHFRSRAIFRGTPTTTKTTFVCSRTSLPQPSKLHKHGEPSTNTGNNEPRNRDLRMLFAEDTLQLR